MMNDCIFCKIQSDKSNWLEENDKFFAIYDIQPIEKGHALIISKRHVENVFGFDDEEAKAMLDLLKKIKSRLDKEFKPIAYNIGINSGKEAGQIIFHAHIHLIPRYKKID